MCSSHFPNQAFCDWTRRTQSGPCWSKPEPSACCCSGGKSALTWLVCWSVWVFFLFFFCRLQGFFFSLSLIRYWPNHWVHWLELMSFPVGFSQQNSSRTCAFTHSVSSSRTDQDILNRLGFWSFVWLYSGCVFPSWIMAMDLSQDLMEIPDENVQILYCEVFHGPEKVLHCWLRQ